MRTVNKVLASMAVVCAMAWAASPAWANCPFSLPMVHSGAVGTPPGAILSFATDINGFFWELGFGDPADGVGNDGKSFISGYPAFTHEVPALRWIKGEPGARRVNYDWYNNGVDGCISGGGLAIGSTVVVYYIIDSNEDYALAANVGTPTAGALPGHYNLDHLLTGVGPNGNDVPMVPRVVAPHVTNVTIVDSNCLDADISPATAGMNLYFDAGVVDVSALTLINDGSPEVCDPATGCHLDCLSRDGNLCWESDALVVASQVVRDSICVGGCLDGFPCSAVFDPSNFCAFAGGFCPPVPSNTTPWGPPISGGCVAIGGTLADDSAVVKATRSRGFTIFQWEATQFGVSHYNLYDITRGDRRINHDVIARRDNNDGSVTSYEFVATSANIRGGKRFELEIVRTDGEKIRFAVD